MKISVLNVRIGPTINQINHSTKFQSWEIKEGDSVFQLAQSNAINRYLARKFNLAGRNDLEIAKADMVTQYRNSQKRIIDFIV
jgi:hypothetical protein